MKMMYDCIEAFQDTTTNEFNLIYTGNNGKNLATASVNAGAGCAIGFSDSIACDGANTWTSSFCQFYANGDSVEDAADKAVEYTEDAHPILNMAGQLKVHSVVIVE